MRMTYLRKNVSRSTTPQTEPLVGSNMVKNSAGGYVFEVDDMVRLSRFLVLGSEGGSYYVKERKLTLDNLDAVIKCVEENGRETIDKIVEISSSGRAAKNSPALFALAIAASKGNDETRKYAIESIPKVARTASNLFEFVSYVNEFRGWGRGLRNGIANWYLSQSTKNLEYQVVKYRNRNDWTHRDLLRKSHIKTTDEDLNGIFSWITSGELPPGNRTLIHAYNMAMNSTIDETVDIISAYPMSWEMLPSETLTDPKIWSALLNNDRIPMTALIRNLSRLTRLGILAPLSDDTMKVDKLLREGDLKRSRIHPISILASLMTYKAGRGVRGKHTWDPVQSVVESLDIAFYRAFENAPQTNKRLYLGIDVSGSMGYGEVNGIPNLTPRAGAAAMAMSIARREPHHHMAYFSTGKNGGWDNAIMKKLRITASDSLDDAIRKTSSLPFGGTDCARPILDALERKMPVDCFIILTDSESWAGRVHVTEALRQYRSKMNIPAKLIVVAMIANSYSVADPNDAGMMDIVGFDTASPQVIADFITS